MNSKNSLQETMRYIAIKLLKTLEFRKRHHCFCFITTDYHSCHMATVNLEFSTTMAQRLNQSRVSVTLQSNLIAIKFGMAEARRLNWALV